MENILTSDQTQEILTLLIKAAGVLLSGVALYLAALVKRKLGVDITAAIKLIESGDRQAIGAALATGATLAFAKGLRGAEAVQFVLDYARRSSPDAVAKMPGSVVSDKARAALEQVAADLLSKVKTSPSGTGGDDLLIEALRRAKADKLRQSP